MFKKLGTIAKGAGGATGDKVRFADIDGKSAKAPTARGFAPLILRRLCSATGDGTADYLISWEGGTVEFYRNNGNLARDTSKPSWEDRGVIAAGVRDQGIVLFGDFDGTDSTLSACL